MSLFLFAKPRLEGQLLCIKCWIRNNANLWKAYILFCKHRVCREKEKMYVPKVRKSMCSGSRWASNLKLSHPLRTDQPWVGSYWYFFWYFGDSPYWCVLEKRKTVTLHHTSDTKYIRDVFIIPTSSPVLWAPSGHLISSVLIQTTQGWCQMLQA